MNPATVLLPPSQVGRALWMVAAALAILATVWIFEAAGVLPCELCLTERYAYYAGAPIAALAAYAASRSLKGLASALFIALALIFLANVALAFYHVGVEQHWWPGPTACTGKLGDVGDLMKSLDSVQVIECDKVQMRILGLSFAGWDAIASAAMAVYAALAAGLRR